MCVKVESLKVSVQACSEERSNLSEKRKKEGKMGEVRRGSERQREREQHEKNEISCFSTH